GKRKRTRMEKQMGTGPDEEAHPSKPLIAHKHQQQLRRLGNNVMKFVCVAVTLLVVAYIAKNVLLTPSEPGASREETGGPTQPPTGDLFSENELLVHLYDRDYGYVNRIGIRVGSDRIAVVSSENQPRVDIGRIQTPETDQYVQLEFVETVDVSQGDDKRYLHYFKTELNDTGYQTWPNAQVTESQMDETVDLFSADGHDHVKSVQFKRLSAGGMETIGLEGSYDGRHYIALNRATRICYGFGRVSPGAGLTHF
ncbi:MAG: hypothetical protein AAF492_20345, partial [Verrucomicrobiota bacterium]